MEKRLSDVDLYPLSGERIRLLLTDESGARWAVTMNPGVEKFIGLYSRLNDFSNGQVSLHYEKAATETLY